MLKTLIKVEEIEFNQKVYILKKSFATQVKDPKELADYRWGYKREEIIINGEKQTVAVGYFKTKDNPEYGLWKIPDDTHRRDLFLRSDFLLPEEIEQKEYITDKDLEIKI